MVYANVLLDLVLIGLLVVGIRYAMRLTSQLADLRQGRLEMERFIGAFNATVTRAEVGVQGLKTAARSCGDDLEKLIEKGHMLRDELTFLTESADLIANRLSGNASQAVRQPQETPKAAQPTTPKAPAASVTNLAAKTAKPLADEMRRAMTSNNKTPSAAEQELLRALEKLG